ncbi:hypothetical protein SCP_0304610 [Sparassis crispa]|uniref:Uncharacterized protein n=1 Tax=Sparassis crispa TaxID=139825 RepID=A0A401GEY7_9APHY|nr:hypothetical protein SCP_0304610 [Sparassis crispa]GBE80742.1 hypothetical protein SCP_0304610 [Sparassis crispa]
MAKLKPLCEKYRLLPCERGITSWALCTCYLDGTLKDGKKPWLYKMLSRRKQRNERAVRIAAGFGWSKNQVFGDPAEQQAPDSNTNRELRRLAEMPCVVFGNAPAGHVAGLDRSGRLAGESLGACWVP